MPSTGGHAAPAFDGVRRAFAENFESRGEAGAAVAVYAGGELVVDVWGGEARPSVPWERDTMVCVFSTTKGVTTFVVQTLVDQDLIDVDERVATYWPEFGVNGKDGITVAQILTHSAGVLSFDDYHEVFALESNDDAAELVRRRIAEAKPYWDPGTMHGYHALTFGWILGEVVRKVTGRTIGTVLREDIAPQLDLDFWIGTPDSEFGRVADLIDAPPPTDPSVVAFLKVFNPGTWTGQAHMVGEKGVFGVAADFNQPRTRRAEIPAGGGIGTARSLARMYGVLAGGGELDGRRLLRRETVDLFAAERVRGTDAVLILESRFGLGYARPTPLSPFGPNDEAFGHGGLGGSFAFADPVAGVGFAYVMNQLQFPNLNETTRAGALVDAVYESLG